MWARIAPSNGIRTVDPPDHAVVISIDEKSQIQALDRTQPGLPMKKGRAGTMTHDYKRHGTTTLFAALDVLDSKVIGRCMPRHRHQEFIRFLDTLETKVPKRKTILAIIDNYAAHKHPRVDPAPLSRVTRHEISDGINHQAHLRCGVRTVVSVRGLISQTQPRRYVLLVELGVDALPGQLRI